MSSNPKSPAARNAFSPQSPSTSVFNPSLTSIVEQETPYNKSPDTMRVMRSRSASHIRPFSRQAVWIAVLALSPLTYLGSFYLAKLLPSRISPITIDREKAVKLAIHYAETRHIDARGWFPSVGANKHKEVAVVFANVRPRALEQVIAASVVIVRLRSPESGRWVRVDLTPTGRVIGFFSAMPAGTAPVIPDGASQDIAVAFLRDFLGPEAPFDLQTPKMHFVDKQKQLRMFEWHSRVPGLPQAAATFQVQTIGERIVSEDCDINFDSGYLKQFRPAHALYVGVMSLGVIYMVLIGIYAVVRYVRRTSDKEVSHRRTILVTLVFAALMMFAIYSGAAEASLSVDGQPPTPGQRIALLGIFTFLFSLMGAFFGLAYGAGEGDVRAVYPGKLTSLDALLSGKLFSSNVARSILAGGAIAGAMLLLQNLALLLTRARIPVGDHALVTTAITSFPLAEALSDTPMNTLAVAAFGLLVPIAFLRPRVRKEWIFYALLPLFSILCATIWTADTSAWRNFIITILVSVAATCIPFFYGDLLASISSVVALDIVARLFYRSAVSERWAQMAAPVVYVGIGFLMMEVYFAWRGKTYEEGEVRPLYARHLAEHLALQAEIGAARQAQLRLLPDAPPQIAGLSIAGSCVPAREVGGDFYDFYALDDHRLGVFLAEGSNGELGSAMTIALAKGYLLYTARQDLSPVEILRRVGEMLSSTLQGEAPMSMLYAVIDTRAASIRFARSGVSPRLVINGHSAVEEVSASRANELAICHGAAMLAPKDALVFYTDGLTAQIAEERREPVDRFLARTTSKLRDGSAADLHSAILKAAIKRWHEAPPDDVTAVVIRLDEPGEQAMEVVA